MCVTLCQVEIPEVICGSSLLRLAEAFVVETTIWQLWN